MITAGAGGVGGRLVQVSALRAGGRRAIRAFGILTAPGRAVPDFLVIGAKRAGTTSLFTHLLAHPRVLPLFPSADRFPMRAHIKGVHYFDGHAGRRPWWYRSHFPSDLTRRRAARAAGGRVVAGEASPYYLHHPLAPARARVVVPEAKLIVLLRNPVDRALSHYREQRRRGFEPLATFEEAIAAEPLRIAEEEEHLATGRRDVSFAFEHQAYVLQGRYVEPLDRWFSVFPREQFLIIRSEDFFDDVQGGYDRVLEFLGLSPFRLCDRSPQNSTVGELMAAATRARLAAAYRPHNRRLESRLGWTTSWDG